MTDRLSSLLCIAAAMLLTAARLASAQDMKPVPVSGNIRWIYNYADGQKSARGSGKPIWVVFRCER